MASTNIIDEAKPCTTCKAAQPADLLLPRHKLCARCHTTTYCSVECQKADWKRHKKVCASNADAWEDVPKRGQRSFTYGEKKYLHGKPEKEVYELLIDTYRMRMEDEYTFTGDVDIDSLYGGGNPLSGFRRFMKKVHKCDGLLPPWWNTKKERECEAHGMNENNWACLRHAAEKSDFTEHYGNPMMPMQLRMIGEIVYGKGPGGPMGDLMGRMMDLST